jgi:hypothetical protein
MSHARQCLGLTGQVVAERRAIKQLLVKVRGGDGASYAVALCSDGSYGITRNNELLEECYSTPDDLENCVEAMMRHAGLGNKPGANRES